MSEYKTLNKDRIREYHRKYQLTAKFKEKRGVYYKKYIADKTNKEKVNNRYKTSKEKITNRILIRLYGVSLEKKRQMWEDQNQRCLICDKKMLFNRNCCIDHNHKSGKNRGILCQLCNQGIGLFKEDTRILQQAIIYLQSYEN